MTRYEMLLHGDNKVRELFDRCWKMYESKGNFKISTWHNEHPDIHVMTNRLKTLSEFGWEMPVLHDYGDFAAYDDVEMFKIKFSSLEELELKLTIAGY